MDAIKRTLDNRPLPERVHVLAMRYEAIALGLTKRFNCGDKSVSIQDITNAQMDARTLHATVVALLGNKDEEL